MSSWKRVEIVKPVIQGDDIPKSKQDIVTHAAFARCSDFSRNRGFPGDDLSEK